MQKVLGSNYLEDLVAFKIERTNPVFLIEPFHKII